MVYDFSFNDHKVRNAADLLQEELRRADDLEESLRQAAAHQLSEEKKKQYLALARRCRTLVHSIQRRREFLDQLIDSFRFLSSKGSQDIDDMCKILMDLEIHS